jgi:hypothetical protein
MELSFLTNFWIRAVRSLNATLNMQDEEDANFDHELFSDLPLLHGITEFVLSLQRQGRLS